MLVLLEVTYVFLIVPFVLQPHKNFILYFILTSWFHQTGYIQLWQE